MSAVGIHFLKGVSRGILAFLPWKLSCQLNLKDQTMNVEKRNVVPYTIPITPWTTAEAESLEERKRFMKEKRFALESVIHPLIYSVVVRNQSDITIAKVIDSLQRNKLTAPTPGSLIPGLWRGGKRDNTDTESSIFRIYFTCTHICGEGIIW